MVAFAVATTGGAALTPRPLPNEASYHVKLGAYCSQVGLLASLMQPFIVYSM